MVRLFLLSAAIMVRDIAAVQRFPHFSNTPARDEEIPFLHDAIRTNLAGLFDCRLIFAGQTARLALSVLILVFLALQPSPPCKISLD